MDTITGKIFLYLIIVLSAVFHEYAHAFVAYRLGDNTAKDMGRLTLNPIEHLDPIGTVLLPLLLLFTSGFFIGWAKPVPYNPYNLRDQKYGSLKVGVAGPSANFIIAILLGLLIRFYPASAVAGSDTTNLFLSFVALIVYVNIFLALFNLIPIPPLDGSKIIMDLFPNSRQAMAQIGFFGIFLALIVAFFILSPIANLLFRLFVGHAFGM